MNASLLGDHLCICKLLCAVCSWKVNGSLSMNCRLPSTQLHVATVDHPGQLSSYMFCTAAVYCESWLKNVLNAKHYDFSARANLHSHIFVQNEGDFLASL